LFSASIEALLKNPVLIVFAADESLDSAPEENPIDV